MSLAVKVEDLSKRYRLGVINRDMLYKDLQSRWAKLRGKPDPNAPITHIHHNRIEKSDDFWALRNVNLEIKCGDVLGIIGRNGAGKSTLLKILSQITAPTEGQIKIKGRVASLLEVGTGFHPELTGRENIFLNGAILGMNRSEVKRKFDEIVAFAGIEEFIDTPVKRYSSGMYVRLGFAVAAHLDPEILIVDEVLAVGDAEFQKKCIGKMKNVSSEGRTVIFVSHNMASIQHLCNKCLLMHGGRNAALSDTDEVIGKYLASFSKISQNKSVSQSADKLFAIKNVILLDQNNTSTTTFRPGECITIELQYEAKHPIEKPYIWFSINDSDGSLLTANMLLDGFRPRRMEGRGYIRVTFDSSELLPHSVYFVKGGMRYEDGRTQIVPSGELATFTISGRAADIGLNGNSADRFLALTRGSIPSYKWETSLGESFTHQSPRNKSIFSTKNNAL